MRLRERNSLSRAPIRIAAFCAETITIRQLLAQESIFSGGPKLEIMVFSSYINIAPMLDELEELNKSLPGGGPKAMEEGIEGLRSDLIHDLSRLYFTLKPYESNGYVAEFAVRRIEFTKNGAPFTVWSILL